MLGMSGHIERFVAPLGPRPSAVVSDSGPIGAGMLLGFGAKARHPVRPVRRARDRAGASGVRLPHRATRPSSSLATAAAT